MAEQTHERLRQLREGGVIGPLRQPSTPSRLRTIWTTRRLAVAAVLWPAMVWVYWNAAGTPSSPVVVVGVGLVAALLLATFVPARGQRLGEAIGSSCGLMAAAYPVLALMAVSQPEAGTGSEVLALVAVGWGLGQRLGPGGCGVKAR